MTLNDIIEISKIEAGIVTKKIESVYLRELFEKLFSETHGIIPKDKKIRLILKDIAKNENPVILTDAIKLRQILNNFIANAIKFTEKGYIEIGYKILENNAVECYVKDTGLGINQNDLEKIFKRFTQINNKLTPYNSGSGLGLSICKAYSELLGGKIRVESTEGEGSCFYLEIPFKQESKLLF